MKASGGGGGRGMRIVRSDAEMPDSFGSARREAETGFKNPDVYCEKFVERPRHIEFQVFADHHGGVWTLGERECSLQRRHQKVLEEGPSPAMTPELRTEMANVIHKAVSSTGYTSLGTLEFLMDENRKLYFLEMNTRVQGGAPGDERAHHRARPGGAADSLSGGGREDLSAGYAAVACMQGHAMECRINAEDPKTFAPWPGLITEYAAPGGNGVRVDSGVYGGWRVPADYDSLLAKLIVHAPTRREAIIRMRRALDEFIVNGIRTNIDLHKALLADHEVIEGTMSTRTVDRITGRGH